MTALAWRAAELAARGWHVFPVEPGGKRPCIGRWEERASADPEHAAAAWGDRWAGSNIGIACGPSGLVVIDLDARKPGTHLPAAWQAERGIVDGSDVFATLAERVGQPWPSTYWVRTPSGGHHLYFAALPGGGMRNTAGKLGPMIDTRAQGGYVVAADSIAGGQVYDLIDGCAPVPVPGWLADLLDPQQLACRPVQDAPPTASLYGRLRGVVEAVLDSREGTRNGRLYWAACRAAQMVAAGKVDRATAERLLVQAAAETGLGKLEAQRTVASGLGAAG
jgi:Bifunctional DNA primase/polymerase, N-terminal